jgi:hypothetical protein
LAFYDQKGDGPDNALSGVLTRSGLHFNWTKCGECDVSGIRDIGVRVETRRIDEIERSTDRVIATKQNRRRVEKT